MVNVVRILALSTFMIMALQACGPETDDSATEPSAEHVEFVRESLHIRELSGRIDRLYTTSGSGPVIVSAAAALEEPPLGVGVFDVDRPSLKILRAIPEDESTRGAASPSGNWTDAYGGVHDLLFDFAAVNEKGITVLQVDVETAGSATLTFYGVGGEVLAIRRLESGEPSIDMGDVSGVRSMHAAMTGAGGIHDIVVFPGSGRGRKGRIVGERVYMDLDRSGSWQADEPGIYGVRVHALHAGADGVLGSRDDLRATTWTDAEGRYRLRALPKGRNLVTVDLETVPGGTMLLGQAIHEVELIEPESSYRADFRLAEQVDPASIRGVVFCDENGNGSREDNEAGVAGIEFDIHCVGPDRVFGSGDDEFFSATTDSDGAYAFDDLLHGACRMTLRPASVPADKYISCGMSFEHTLRIGEDVEDVDFCLVPTGLGASIGDEVYCDLNDSGSRDEGEPGIPDILVHLTMAGPDGVFDTADDVMTSQVTDSEGRYLFEDIPPGLHIVFVEEDSAPPGKRLGCDEKFKVKLEPDEAYLLADFCFVPNRGRIGDLVFLDADGDGVKDEAEPGVADVAVELTWYGEDAIPGTKDDVVSTMSTDADGRYEFSSLPPGEFAVRVLAETAPEGTELGTCPASFDVSLRDREAFLDADFCLQPTPEEPGELSGAVFVDDNLNATRDTGEPGIPGVTVRIRLAGLDGVLGNDDDEYREEVTDTGGLYHFEDLPVGDTETWVDPATVPEEYDQGFCLEVQRHFVGEGEHVMDVDFCYVDPPDPVILPGRVFCDLNRDGLWDANEPGVVDVRIVLTCAGDDEILGNDDDIELESFSDADGMYRFEDLPEGECRLDLDEASIPVDKLPGICPATVFATLVDGEVFVAPNFCVVPDVPDPGLVRGIVFCDDNDNMRQDGREIRLAGVVVRLTFAGTDGEFSTFDDIVFSQITPVEGTYAFGFLAPGDYQLAVDESTVPLSKSRARCPVRADLQMVPSQVYERDFCFASCNECLNYVSALTLRYLGPAPAMIRVRQHNNYTVFHDTVAPGEEFSFVGGFRGSFGPSVKISVDGGANTIIDTSCEMPVGPGQVFGEFEILAGESKLGGPLCRVAPSRPTAP